MGPSFNVSSTCNQERRGTNIYRQLDKKLCYEKQAHNACRTACELPGHFPSKIRFVFRSKTYPTNDSMMKKRSKLKTTMTSQSRVSVPFSPFSARSFWKRFREAVGWLRTFLLLFSAQKEKFPRNFSYMFFL